MPNTFTLTIPVQDLLLKYYSPPDRIKETKVPLEKVDTTHKLQHEKSKRYFYFFDHRKTRIKYWVNMFGASKNDRLPNKTNKCCWHDRHTFASAPVGLPLAYYPVTPDFLQDKIPDEKDIFLTEGVFCSLPCMIAYAHEKNHENKYRSCFTLISLMLMKMGIAEEIPPAPSWKILIEYDGHLTIDEFRASFDKIRYTELNNYQLPIMLMTHSYTKEVVLA
jgi:hypothetical protein